MLTNKKAINFRLILIGTLILMLFSTPERQWINSTYLFFLSLLSLIILFVHFYLSKSSNWFRPDVIFLIGFIIVHFQWPIMIGLSNLFPDNLYRILVDPRLINFTTYLSLIGLISWMIGFYSRSDFKIKFNLKTIYAENKSVLTLIILFVLFIALAGKDFLTGSVYKGLGGSTSGEGISKYLLLIFQTLIITITVVISINSSQNNSKNIFVWVLSLNKWYLLVILCYILLFLSIGDRGGPISVVILILLLYSYFVRPIKFIHLFLIILSGATILTIISLGRSNLDNKNILSAGAENLELNSGYDITLELANSVRTLNKAVSQVPSSDSYFYGQLWLSDLLSVIPFAQSAVVDVTGMEPYEMNSSGYITTVTLGKNSTSGEGTSIIADLYLNFGVFGICIGMYALGIVFRFVNNSLNNKMNIIHLIISATIGSYALYYSRAGFFVPLRDIIWALLLYWLLVSKRKVA